MRLPARVALHALLLLTLCAAVGARAESTRELFERGNTALLRGEPETALSHYQTLAESGSRDADLEFNLALAHAELGQLGRALWRLLRARELRPGDQEISRAIERVQDTLGKRQAAREGEATVQTRPPLLEAMTAWVSRDALAIALWLTVAVASLAWIVLQRERREGRRLGAGVTLSVALLLAALCGFGLAVKRGALREGRRAIVLDGEVALREGPDERSPRVRTLTEGTRARQLEELGNYARIEVDEEAGWVPESALGRY